MAHRLGTWCIASVVLPDNSILLMGGSGNDGYWNDTWESNDQGATWLELTAAAWTARYAPTCVKLPDGSIVLMGRNDGGNRNDVWRLIIDGD